MNSVDTTKDNCLAGKILRVNLSTRKIWTEPTAPYISMGLGGRGINSLIMLREIPIGTKWNSPENLLCFGAGSMVGTMVPGADRMDISTLSVFSGGKGSANVGGFFAPEMKYAGYDNIIISGISKTPVYLLVRDDKVEICDASSIWGKGTYETERILRNLYKDPRIEIAQIGPAGENLVCGSAIIVDIGKAAGGSGVGCVMGSKKLKAIVVRGTGGIKCSNPVLFMAEIDNAFKQCAEEPMTPKMRKALSTLYTDPDFPGWNNLMSVRNGQDEYWPREKKLEAMNPETGALSYRNGIRACYNCPTGCMAFMKFKEGAFKGFSGEGFWVNTLVGHACRLDNSDPETIAYSWLETNNLGLDGDFTASTCAWVFELYELGIITEEDTDGLELTWGDGMAFIELMRRIANRNGKLAKLLADSPVKAAEIIGNDATYYLAHIKGQPTIESFRSMKGWGIAVSSSPIAGRHMRGATMGSKLFGPRPRPDTMPVDPLKYEDQPQICYWQSRTKELEDDLGICIYAGTWSGANFHTIENYAGYVKYGLGLDVSQEDLMEHYAPIGRNLEKAFNTLHTDMSINDDMPPLRLQREAIKSGPHKGMKADASGYMYMLKELYRLWGWDPETGMQTRSCLERLGLHEVVEKLEKAKKLIEK